MSSSFSSSNLWISLHLCDRGRKEEPTNMVHGKLEVLLVSAKGLEDTDFLSKPPLPLSFIFFFSRSRNLLSLLVAWRCVSRTRVVSSSFLLHHACLISSSVKVDLRATRWQVPWLIVVFSDQGCIWLLLAACWPPYLCGQHLLLFYIQSLWPHWSVHSLVHEQKKQQLQSFHTDQPTRLDHQKHVDLSHSFTPRLLMLM